MKLPVTSSHFALIKQDQVILDGAKDKQERYRIDICTAKLGANRRNAGHPFLKHCFAKIMTNDGGLLGTLAYGRDGVVEEPWPDLESSSCETQAINLSSAKLKQFVTVFRQQGSQAYKWGSNDCCSLVNSAVEQGLNHSSTFRTNRAANDIKHSREVI